MGVKQGSGKISFSESFNLNGRSDVKTFGLEGLWIKS